MTGTGFLAAAGGDASQTGGGGGSGGRIKYYFFSWFNSTIAPIMAKNLNITMKLDGGPGGIPS